MTGSAKQSILALPLDGLLRFARNDAWKDHQELPFVMPGQKRAFALDVPGIHVQGISVSDKVAPNVEYGVTPTHVMASMSGLDFVRAIFDGRLPSPPIMQNVEPFDSTAEIGHVVFHSVPGFRHYNPIGSVHGGYAAILLDSAMGLAVHTALPAGTGYTTLEFKISFIKGMTKDTGPVRTEGKTLNVGRRAATAEARITDAKGRLLAHATTTCLVFEIPKGT
jgi:uncharacterized protein (TIGR00369 family)